ncbi:MAG: hypothetical protein LUI60_07850 [Clostridia bacterium]|nr:hypothetical protein [Clostridia bacterium]
MKKLSLKKLNSPDTAEGVEQSLLAAGFVPFDTRRDGITLMTVFKGKERHTGRKKKTDGTRVKLQSYCRCEGAEDKIFIAVSVDSDEAAKKCRHISCTVYSRQKPSAKKSLF